MGAQKSSGFEISILGTRGNIEPQDRRHARHSGILLGGELLLDVGEPQFLRYHPRWILVTHLHPDHAFFVKHAVADLRVYAPEAHPSAQVRIVRPGELLRLGHWRVTALRVLHSQKVRSLAYRVDRGGRSLLYTGDMLDLAEGCRRVVDRLDLVVAEGSFIRSGGFAGRDARTGRKFGHAGLPELIALFSRFAPRILVVHLGSWFYRDPRAGAARIRALGRANGVVASVAWDGMRYVL